MGNIEKQIADLIERDDDWRDRLKVLKSMPGVGDATAATLIAELPKWARSTVSRSPRSLALRR